MKKSTKILVTVGCAMLLIVSSVAGTLAYLTSKDTVTNTFTAGNVTITLDESKVTTDGLPDGSSRVKTNEYKLIPDKTYKKDPVLHVGADSEPCWAFIKVKNGISDVEDTGNTIENQIGANGWIKITETLDPSVSPGETVYYMELDTAALSAKRNYPVFEEFTISPEATGTALSAVGTVEVTAFAIQEADGFKFSEDLNGAKKAWTALHGATP